MSAPALSSSGDNFSLTGKKIWPILTRRAARSETGRSFTASLPPSLTDCVICNDGRLEENYDNVFGGIAGGGTGGAWEEDTFF
jgi:hypothetical protein